MLDGESDKLLTYECANAEHSECRDANCECQCHRKQPEHIEVSVSEHERLLQCERLLRRWMDHFVGASDIRGHQVFMLFAMSANAIGVDALSVIKKGLGRLAK